MSKARRSRALVAVLAVCALGAVTTACSSNASPSEKGTTGTAKPTASSAPTPTPESSSAAAVRVDEALTAAAEAMTIYLSHDTDADNWWKQLRPYLTSDAAYYIEGTNPLLVPGTKITGDPIVQANSGGSVTILVPTDGGQYTLVMIRQGDVPANAPWSVFSLTPPAR